MMGRCGDSRGEPRTGWRQVLWLGVLTLGLLSPGPAQAEPETEMQAARKARDQGQVQRAIQHADQALRELDASGKLDSEQGGSATFLHAQLLQRAGNRERARQQYELALERWRSSLGTTHPNVAGAHAGLAEVLVELGQPAKAVAHRKQVLAILEPVLGAKHPLVGTSVHNLANALLKSGDHKAAREQFTRAVRIRTTALGKHPDVAQSLVGLGAAEHALGDHQAAWNVATEAAKLFKHAGKGNEDGLARALELRGAVALDRGQYEVAKEQVAKALQLKMQKAKGASASLANSLGNLAEVLTALGQHNRAEVMFREAMAMHAQLAGASHPNVAHLRGDLAHLLLQKGNLPAAKSVAQPALEIFEKHYGKHHPELSRPLRVLARVAEYESNPTLARQYVDRLVEIQRRLSSSAPGYAAALTVRAALLDRADDPAGALADYAEARKIYERIHGPRSPQVAVIAASEAALASYQGDYQKAYDSNRVALERDEAFKGKDHPDLIASLMNLALASTKVEKGELAQGYAARAADLRELQLGLIMSTGAESERRAAYATAFTETNGILALHLRVRPDDARLAKVAYRTLLQRKGRLLDELAWTRRGSAASVPAVRALLQTLADRRSDLSQHLTRNLGKPNYTAESTRLRAEILGLERRLGERVPAQAQRFAQVTPETVLGALPQGAALIDYVKYRPINLEARRASERWYPARYAAYVLADGALRHVDLGGAVAIDKAVTALRSHLSKPGTSVEQSARALDRLVFEPVRPLLGKAARIYVAPDGLLNIVPFAVLKDESDHFAVESFELTTLGSGRDLLRLGHSEPAQGPAVVIANPDFGAPTRDGGAASDLRGLELVGELFAPLPATAEEGRIVAEAIGANQTLSGAAATVDALGELHGPEILHIATHGFFVPHKRTRAPVDQSFNPLLGQALPRIDDPMMRTGLALAGANRVELSPDGVLSGYEAASLDLRGTKLVVLSACQTGLGDVIDGLEVQGLRRAFTIAGAESLLVSLWPVSDEGTKELMTTFYSRLKEGAGRSAALREAQLAFLQTDAYQHPFYWGAFIMDGKARALDGSLDTLPDRAPPGSKVDPGARGCSCRITPSRSTGGLALLAAGLVLTALRRRRTGARDRIEISRPPGPPR